MKLKLMLGAALLALASCGTNYAPVTTAPVEVTYTQRAIATNIIRFATPTLRTGRWNAEGKREEITGAKCELLGTGIKASFVTPAIVRIPMHKGVPASVILTCNDGTTSRSASVGIVNVTAQNIQNGGAAAGGLVGALIASAVVASRDPKNDEFRYIDTMVMMNEKPN